MLSLVSVLLCLMEFKNELGGTTAGDPFFQQLREYQMYYEEPARAKSAVRRGDTCPGLLVEVVGPLLRISAVASLRGNTVMAEPLTPFVHFLKVDGQRQCVHPWHFSRLFILHCPSVVLFRCAHCLAEGCQQARIVQQLVLPRKLRLRGAERAPWSMRWCLPPPAARPPAQVHGQPRGDAPRVPRGHLRAPGALRLR